MNSLKSKQLNKSSIMSSASSTSSARSTKSKLLKSEAKILLNSNSLDNVEIEYIKNLQQQVYFLELECNYLRQQMNVNGFQSSLKYDDKSQELKSQMLSIQMEKSSLEKNLNEQNSENETVLQLLEQTERNFHKERELLLKEISNLKKQKLDLEEGFIAKSVELTKVQENLEKHHLSAHHTVRQTSKVEIQFDNLRKDNQLLRTEINEARTQLISRDNFIKDLQDQFNDPKRKQTVNEELKSTLSTMTTKLSQTNETLTKEAVLNKQLSDENLRFKTEHEVYSKNMKELTRENDRLSTLVESSLKQNESDLLLAKKNAEQSKATIEKLTNDLESEKLINHNLKSQIEQFKLTERLDTKNASSLKTRIKELEESISTTTQAHDNLVKNLHDQLEAKQNELDSSHTANKSLELKINELNDTIDNFQLNHKVQLETSKTKLNETQMHLDEHSLNLANEKNNNKNLQLSIENFKRQEEIHTNLIASLKVRVNELDTQLIDLTHREPTLLNQLQNAEHKIKGLESEKEHNLSEITTLKQKIERLNSLEDLLKSQKWSEFGKLADSMKNLSLSMSNTVTE